ncbi:Flp pilus assembly protein CpaB [Phenylobacterium sp.]|jgi:pilus assembly protein CpaB|uniref:Flp pilus assembly protein CpaB n=1 Tax=Phenylobacterium sp. TaxID=1871053 RepID=UPI002E343351|nr:Flp pilus assembly protein CpaB [Phenylobacterium sp.]HEX2561499.1 Flp pilus assembly protein CpaB [Phenylobacterium sp.]
MRLVTIVSLGASAALGLAALFVAKVVLPQEEATAGVVRPIRTVPVVVAAKPIPYGVKLGPEHLALAQYPPESAPAGAFTSIEQILSQDEGGPPVVLMPIGAKEAVLPAKLSGAGARPSVAAVIADGMRAYTIRVTDVSGVGGLALPGDRVDVLLMRDLSGDSNNRYLVTEVVLQNVRMLGVDLNADQTSTETTSPKTATLEVSMEDAQKLAMAGDLGSLSLALRRSGAAEIEPTAPVETYDVVSIGPAPAPAPPRAASGGARAPAKAAAPQRSSPILIIEGDKPAPEGA